MRGAGRNYKRAANFVLHTNGEQTWQRVHEGPICDIRRDQSAA